MIDDDAIRDLVRRLGRQDPSGGKVIERAAILAAGADSGAVVSWILAHDGQPEALPASARGGGLHGARLHGGPRDDASVPRRYLLPPGALS